MGKCSVCKKKIEYNKFKRYRGKILCYDCYDTRLERKKAKKEATEAKIKEDEAKVLADALKKAEEGYNPYEENQKDEETGDNMPVKMPDEE